MQNRPQARAIAKRDDRQGVLRQWVLGSVIGVAFLWTAAEVFADGHVEVIESHGLNEYGELKYPADFAHLDYVNPDAPVGGEISVSTLGNFDSLNPFATLSGTPAALSSSVWETLLTTTSDEVGSNYCLLCTTIE